MKYHKEGHAEGVTEHILRIWRFRFSWIINRWYIDASFDDIPSGVFAETTINFPNWGNK